MGSTFRIVAYAPDCRTASRAATASFEHVARLDSLFSDYRSDSEIALLERSGRGNAFIPVSDELWSILADAQRWAQRTDGAFDVTVGPVTRLWRWSARRAELPEPQRLAAARAAVGFQYLVLDPGKREVCLEKPGMSLDLGGIAKGYAADAAVRVLMEHGIDAVLVDAGGDVAVGAPPPEETGWLVELPSGESIRLARAAVATSGDTYRFVNVDGVRYSHIIDPRTGLGVVGRRTVTVVAPNATTADALASAVAVMDRAAAEALVRSVDGAWTSVAGDSSWTSGLDPYVDSRTPGEIEHE
jgi:thiamine biosynthesis lipoprotein